MKNAKFEDIKDTRFVIRLADPNNVYSQVSYLHSQGAVLKNGEPIYTILDELYEESKKNLGRLDKLMLHISVNCGAIIVSLTKMLTGFHFGLNMYDIHESYCLENVSGNSKEIMLTILRCLNKNEALDRPMLSDSTLSRLAEVLCDSKTSNLKNLCALRKVIWEDVTDTFLREIEDKMSSK